MPLTPETFQNLERDIDDTGKAINTKAVINPRYGAPFYSLPLAVQKVMETGGFEPFLTETQLLASTPTISPKAAKALDTKKIWYWGKYDESETVDSWHDTGLSELDQAINFTRAQFGLTAPSLYSPDTSIKQRYVQDSTTTVEYNPDTEMAHFPVQAGKTYAVRSTTFDSGLLFVVLRDTASTDVGTTIGRLQFSPTDDPNVMTFTVPAGSTATHAMFNVYLPLFNFDIREYCAVSQGNEISSVEKIMGLEIQDQFLRGNALLKSAIDEVKDLYDKSTNSNDKYVNAVDASVSASSGTIMGKIPVEAGKTYAIQASDFGLLVLSYRATNSTDYGPTLGKATLNNTSVANVKTFTVPDNSTAKIALFNIKLPATGYDISESLVIQQGTSILDYEAVVGVNGKPVADLEAREAIEELTAGNSILKGKRWIAIGDSITEHNFRTNLNYHDYVSQAVGGMTIYNYGISGSGFKDRSSVADTITQPVDIVDIVTVFFGTNDWGFANKPLGMFLDNTEETIAGCINICLTKLLNKFSNKVIALLTPLPRLDNWGSNASSNSQGYTLEQLVSLIIKYAKHYSIPYLDLYHESNLPVWVPAANEYYFTAPNLPEPDGLHPNDAGHKVIARKVKAFLESI